MFTLTDITGLTGLTKNKVFRILATLQECEFVDRTPEGTYCLNVRFLEFGHKITGRFNVAALGAPVLDWLVEETGESAFISVVHGTQALCIAARESPSPIRLAASAGRRLPLYAGATPTVLLAFMPDKDRDNLLNKIELTQLTPQTITQRPLLDKHLAKIREQGYVVTLEDLTEGARGVGAPIRDFSGEVIASISVSGITKNFTSERVKRYVKLILEGAARISKALGYKG